MYNFTDSEIRSFLDDFEQNSRIEFIEEASKISELKKIVKARGLDLGSRDLGYFSSIWAFTGRKNANGAILEESEIIKKLPQLIGKPINRNHERDKILGVYVDFKYIAKKHEIKVFGTFFKSYYPDMWEEAKKLHKKGKLSSSFEIWSPLEDRQEHKDGSYTLKNTEIAGGALVFQDEENKPAFEGADVLAMAKEIKNQEFYKDLVFATTKKYRCKDLILATDEKVPCSNCGECKMGKPIVECPKCKNKFDMLKETESHMGAVKCSKCGTEVTQKNLVKSDVQTIEQPKVQTDILKIKCSNCSHEFEAKSDIHIGCPECKAVLNREGTMIYPPQIQDFRVNCLSCRTRNWLILSTNEDGAKVKCNQCSKVYNIKFSKKELPDAIKNINFVYSTSISCPQCGKSILFSGVSSVKSGKVKCKKCGLDFPFDIEKSKKYKNISSIEEIIDKKDDKENKGGKEMELNKDKKEEKVQKPEETKVEDKKSDTSDKTAPKEEAPKSEEKKTEKSTEETTEKVEKAIEVVDGEPKVVEKAEETPKEESKVEETEEKKEESKEDKVEDKKEETPKAKNKEEEKAEETKEELEDSEIEESAKWTRKFINRLPDSSFAVIEPAYKSGKTDNKNARHLPFKDASGKVDLPHLRNALARMNQIKPVTDSISAESLRAKAKSKLKKFRKNLKTVKSNKKEKAEVEKYPKTKVLRKAVTKLKELKSKVTDNDTLVEDIKKLKSAIRKLAKRVVDAKKETKLYKEDAKKIIERRDKLGDYKKDEITDAQLLEDTVFERAMLDKEKLEAQATQTDEKPVVGTKKKDNDFYSKKRKKIDDYIANKLDGNKKELEKAKINVD